jgi:multidrug efflux system membrane fusion protein
MFVLPSSSVLKVRPGVLSSAAVLLVVAACSKPQKAPPRAPATVAVATAERVSVPYTIEANGVVAPLQSVAVLPQVEGIITSVDFQEGQEVRAGQVLFHIDDRPYRAAYMQALAVLARDSANAANAAAQVNRYAKLVKSKVVTAEEGDQLSTAAATTQATVSADRAAVANARFNLDNTVVRAPISGKTGSVLVKRGNLVRAGGSVPLVVINQVRPILVRFAVPSSQLPLILQYGARGGLPVAAIPGGIAPAPADSNAADMDPSGPPGGAGAAGGNAAVTQQGVGADPAGPRLMGKLSFIDNAVDTATGTVQLKATFDNANGMLWAGQFASTSLHLFDEDSALVVPTQAVVAGQRGNYVYVVDPSDTARQRAVTVERTANGLAVITSGIRVGDRVVTDGQSRLTPDAPVTIRSAEGSDLPGAVAKRGRRGGAAGPAAPAAPPGKPGSRS